MDHIMEAISNDKCPKRRKSNLMEVDKENHEQRITPLKHESKQLKRLCTATFSSLARSVFNTSAFDIEDNGDECMIDSGYGQNDSIQQDEFGFGQATRRCLFNQSPSSPNFSTRSQLMDACNASNKFFKDSTDASNQASNSTPISVYKSNAIITPEANNPSIASSASNSTLLDYSLDTIELQLSDVHNDRRLIGDRSRYHILPCKTSIKHNDLSVIEPETLKSVLDGDFDMHFDQLIIIDSRYPYEYQGGHIINANNIYTKEKLIDKFLSHKQISENKPQHRQLIIFHCEFSSERGPRLLRFLRNQDRAINRDHYPKLHYPELYLLEGGYKAFYEKYKDYCEPKTYKPMLHQDHISDLKHFRSKTKTWQQPYNLKSSLLSTQIGSKLKRCPRSNLF